MEIELKRVYGGSTFTLGDLYLNGKFFCSTIEDLERDLKTEKDKVYGCTAIPRGRYRIVLTRSMKFKRILPLLLNVPFFEGIRIHAGNTEKDSLGCIIVGERRRPYEGYVYESRKTEKRLMDVLTQLPAGEEIWISIE